MLIALILFVLFYLLFIDELGQNVNKQTGLPLEPEEDKDQWTKSS